jgi:hypothetical protein
MPLLVSSFVQDDLQKFDSVSAPAKAFKFQPGATSNTSDLVSVTKLNYLLSPCTAVPTEVTVGPPAYGRFVNCKFGAKTRSVAHDPFPGR